ncbi:hypothetical protein ADUPG1_000467 [Aduncisulcus paluster]|uniref:Uncharacterized protein n=1 Tax=Aduncisulcus paluster TaxID=2918883 RepID=A0ABQ5K876_9EUKA|nr:hypothetical protein ADUPG1_000467 [Aduncisulcus paluster]
MKPDDAESTQDNYALAICELLVKAFIKDGCMGRLKDPESPFPINYENVREIKKIFERLAEDDDDMYVEEGADGDKDEYSNEEEESSQKEEKGEIEPKEGEEQESNPDIEKEEAKEKEEEAPISELKESEKGEDEKLEEENEEEEEKVTEEKESEESKKLIDDEEVFDDESKFLPHEDDESLLKEYGLDTILDKAPKQLARIHAVREAFKLLSDEKRMSEFIEVGGLFCLRLMLEPQKLGHLPPFSLRKMVLDFIQTNLRFTEEQQSSITDLLGNESGLGRMMTYLCVHPECERSEQIRAQRVRDTLRDMISAARMGDIDQSKMRRTRTTGKRRVASVNLLGGQKKKSSRRF